MHKGPTSTPSETKLTANESGDTILKKNSAFGSGANSDMATGTALSRGHIAKKKSSGSAGSGGNPIGGSGTFPNIFGSNATGKGSQSSN